MNLDVSLFAGSLAAGGGWVSAGGRRTENTVGSACSARGLAGGGCTFGGEEVWVVWGT